MNSKSYRWIFVVGIAALAIIGWVVFKNSNRKPPTGVGPRGAEVAEKTARTAGTLAALSAKQWEESLKDLPAKYRADTIAQVMESSEKARALYATLSDEQRAELLRTGSYSLAGAKATPAQAQATRAWLATSEMDGMRHNVGDPPDLSKIICTFDKRSINNSPYLCFGLEKTDGSYRYGGHQIAAWPENK